MNMMGNMSTTRVLTLTRTPYSLGMYDRGNWNIRGERSSMISIVEADICGKNKHLVKEEKKRKTHSKKLQSLSDYILSEIYLLCCP